MNRGVRQNLPTIEVTSERFVPRLRGHELDSYDHRLHITRFRFAADLVAGRVLDIACGTGYGSYELMMRGCQYVVAEDLDEGQASMRGPTIPAPSSRGLTRRGCRLGDSLFIGGTVL